MSKRVKRDQTAAAAAAAVEKVTSTQWEKDAAQYLTRAKSANSVSLRPAAKREADKTGSQREMFVEYLNGIFTTCNGREWAGIATAVYDSEEPLYIKRIAWTWISSDAYLDDAKVHGLDDVPGPKTSVSSSSSSSATKAKTKTAAAASGPTYVPHQGGMSLKEDWRHVTDLAPDAFHELFGPGMAVVPPVPTPDRRNRDLPDEVHAPPPAGSVLKGRRQNANR